jgi:hypothetical protein
MLQGVESAEVTSSDKNSQQIRNKNALDTATKWLAALPSETSLAALIATSSSQIENQGSSLQRCLVREVSRGRNALSLVRKDLEQVKSYCMGDCKATNSLRQLLSCMHIGAVPISWRSEYSYPLETTIGAWVVDLTSRTRVVEKYKPILNSDSDRNIQEEALMKYWLGGMFVPHSFIIATRQHAAHAYKWSLEELELYLEIGIDKVEGIQDVIVEGLFLEGANWIQNPLSTSPLQLCEELRSPLPLSRLRWRLRQSRPEGAFVAFPLYLNSSRSELVVEVLLRVPNEVPVCTWAQRGVAFILQAPLL